MWKYVGHIAYVGTQYTGWQRQKQTAQNREVPSIQAALESLLFRITGEQVSVVASGRTDSGVHSVGQVAHFVLRGKCWDPDVLQKALNSLLSSDVAVYGLSLAPIQFHAQRSAVKKQYSYYFQQGPCALPHLYPTSYWIRKGLDLDAMNLGLKTLVGEHDFKPFQGAGSKPGSTVRKILEAEVTRVSVGFPLTVSPEFFLVRVRVLGTGFLKQMVRGIAGTLLQVGEGRRAPSCFQEILKSQDRSQVGPTAPSRGLWLEQVWYEDSNFVDAEPEID